ncbi:hypothetical protein [Limnohabitans sp.]|uniref:hypothetical protein n=1 Tax=Limnohabitans sp. TaxID=1907725 RepID=UPI0035ADD958
MTTNTPSALPENIPELDLSNRILEVPERIAVALDARSLEKTMLAEMVSRWLEELRPEMERMAQDIVQRSAEAYWLQHACDPTRR